MSWTSTCSSGADCRQVGWHQQQRGVQQAATVPHLLGLVPVIRLPPEAQPRAQGGADGDLLDDAHTAGLPGLGEHLQGRQWRQGGLAAGRGRRGGAVQPPGGCVPLGVTRCSAITACLYCLQQRAERCPPGPAGCGRAPLKAAPTPGPPACLGGLDDSLAAHGAAQSTRGAARRLGLRCERRGDRPAQAINC
jgi:hypothetical protein